MPILSPIPIPRTDLHAVDLAQSYHVHFTCHHCLTISTQTCASSTPENRYLAVRSRGNRTNVQISRLSTSCSATLPTTTLHSPKTGLGTPNFPIHGNHSDVSARIQHRCHKSLAFLAVAPLFPLNTRLILPPALPLHLTPPRQNECAAG